MKIDGVPLSEQLKMMRGITAPKPVEEAGQASPEKGKVSFGEFLARQFNDVNAQGLNAERAIERALEGKEVNPHNTIIAVQKANISLTLMMTIKERLERAYQEIIRMQV